VRVFNVSLPGLRWLKSSSQSPKSRMTSQNDPLAISIDDLGCHDSQLAFFRIMCKAINAATQTHAIFLPSSRAQIHPEGIKYTHEEEESQPKSPNAYASDCKVLSIPSFLAHITVLFLFSMSYHRLLDVKDVYQFFPGGHVEC